MMSGPEKRLVRSKSGLRVLPIKDNERSPFELSEPEWIKDNFSSSCTSCLANFDFVRRKHHCRRCGKIYCNTCSKKKLALPRMCFLDPVRMCSPCAKITSEENNFYKFDLKNLTTGVDLEVSDNFSCSNAMLLHCCLSPDHRNILFTGPVSQTIPLLNIINISNFGKDENENRTLNKFSFAVNGEDRITELRLPADHTPLAPAFLGSLHKAVLMTEEAKSIIGTGE